MRTKLLVLSLLVLSSLVGAAPASAMTAIGVTGAAPQNLVRFDTTDPTTILATTAISGLGTDERIVGTDWHQEYGKLYALTRNTATNEGRLYELNPFTGVLSSGVTLAADPADLTMPYTALPASSAVDIDVNPVNNLIRVASNAVTNLRLNALTGYVTTDNDFNPAAPVVSGVAYTNNYATAVATTLYAYDTNTDGTFIVNPPNNGTLSSVGGTGAFYNGLNLGLDIYSDALTNVAYASFNAGSGQQLFTLDLATGTDTLVSPIGAGNLALTDFALLPTVVNVVSQTASAVEGSNAALIRVTRENGAQSAIVNWTATAGTASAGEFAASGTATFAPGVTSIDVPITVVDDAIDEPAETFTVTFTPNTNDPSQLGVPLIAPHAVTVTIGDNDTTTIPPVVEPKDTTKPFVFLVPNAAMRLATFTKSGVTLLATTSEKSTGKFELLLGTKVIATTPAASNAAALITKKLKATKAGAKLIAAKKGKRIPLVARLTLTDAAGNVTVVKRAFVLTR